MQTVSEMILGHRGGIGNLGQRMIAAAEATPVLQEYLALIHEPRSGDEDYVLVKSESWARAHEDAIRHRPGWTVLEVV